MNIFWIDPVNSDPQFINLMSIIFRQAGNNVTICSNARNIFGIPAGIEWIPFSTIKSFPISLENRPLTKLWFASLYPFDWFRACLFAKKRKIRSILFSTNLALPSVDTFYIRFLRKIGIAPVVIVHTPYRDFFYDPDKITTASRYKRFYETASLILVMSEYIGDQMKSLFNLPKDKLHFFKHPHFQPLLNRYKTSSELVNKLEKWRSGSPVISFLSKISYDHGLDNLLESLPFLNELLNNYNLLMVARSGSSQYRTKVVDKLNKLDCSYKWHWDIYSFSELKAYLKSTTVTVLPYNYASQSACLTMSSGMGIPIVASCVGGLPEMIQPGVNGELVPPHNAKLLAETINKVVCNVESYVESSKSYAEQEFSPMKAARTINHALSIASV